MMKLAIAQMVFGVLILSDFLMAAGAGRWSGVFILPFTTFLLLGCGIAQFLKARE